MDARLHDFDVPGSGGREKAASRPVSEKWDSVPDTGKWLADRHLGSANARVPYRIEGWLAETGTSVWFGAGSTGKTQLMLWMAAMIASRREDRLEHVWLGGRINGTGHVLVLTAEDTREQIVGRLRDVIEHSLGQDGEAALRTCRRIHVMPFLSMTEDEFRHLSPSLFEQSPKERLWEASAVMEEVRRYVRDWNGSHDDPEERIVGVVMDSATSMAGFDSMSANRIFGIVKDGHGHDPRADLVRTAHSGGRREARPGAINWHLMQLERQGVLEKRGRNFHVLPSTAAAGRT